MDLTRFSADQRRALLELLVLAMYSDGHLASAEDDAVNQVAEELGMESDHERRLLIDAIFTKVARLPRTEGALHGHISGFAPQFPTPGSRRDACQAIDELLRSDKRLAPQENQFMTLLRQVFES